MTLTVNTDNKAPTLVSVAGSDSFTQATLAFSEPVTAPSATTAANYAFSGGVTVSSAQLVDPFTVQLTTSKQAASTAYTVTVNNVKDIAGHSVAAASQIKLDSWILAPKRVKMERYTGISNTFKEGGGGDWAQVAMRRVGVTSAVANLPPISDEMWYWAPPGTQDVTQPSDKIVATSTNSPAAEGVANVIDNSSSTKYLNFDKLNTGFTVTPAAGATTVTGIAFTSANDAAPRDPSS